MKPLSEHLVALIASIEIIMRWPAERPIAFFEPPRGFAEVASEIRRAHERPAEGIRCTYAAIAMLALIEGFAATGDPRWQHRMGVMIELLQADAWAALNSETAMRGEAREEYRHTRAAVG